MLQVVPRRLGGAVVSAAEGGVATTTPPPGLPPRLQTALHGVVLIPAACKPSFIHSR